MSLSAIWHLITTCYGSQGHLATSYGLLWVSWPAGNFLPLAISLSAIWQLLTTCRESFWPADRDGSHDQLLTFFHGFPDLLTISDHLPLSQESARHLPLSQESARHLLLSKESAPHLPLSQESVRHLPLSQESARHLPLSQKSARHLPLSQESADRLPTPDWPLWPLLQSSHRLLPNSHCWPQFPSVPSAEYNLERRRRKKTWPNLKWIQFPA